MKVVSELDYSRDYGNTGFVTDYRMSKCKKHFRHIQIHVFSTTSGLIFPTTKCRKKPEKELTSYSYFSEYVK